MPQERYFGEYVKFYALDKKSAVEFMGADNLVGDAYTIDIKDEDGEYKAYLTNRFGKTVGYLEERVVRRIQLAQAKGWETAAFLSFVAFTEGTDEDHPGYYWGEMAVLAYEPRLSEEMEPFRARLAKAMADGGRPQVDFGDKAVEQLVQERGAWFPSDKASKPKMGKGSSILKDHQTPNERLIERSRKGTVGCYIASWAFILAILALVVFGLHSCGVF